MQPKLVVSYGNLPLSFEENQGQVPGPVKFLSRGPGYTIFLTDDGAVLTLWRSQPGMSRLGKFGLSGRPDPFDAVDLRAGRWRSLTDNLKSLWPSLIPDLGQMVPEPFEGKRGVAAEPESQAPQVVQMRLVGNNAKARVVGLNELPGKSNYFIGNDPKKWRTNISNYSRVEYQNVYAGVDLVYYGNQRQLEYDFVVAPGADPSQIKLSFAGADGMRVDAASGDLVLKLGDDEVRFQKPAVYQPAVAAVSSPQANPMAAPSGLEAGHSSLATRDSSFVLASNNQVGLRVAGYDSKRALVIDPVLTYSTYLGGTSVDNGNGIAVDSSGNAYVTGHTISTNFPVVGPIQAKCGNGCLNFAGDVFVSKLSADGSALIYSTYLGGFWEDIGNGIAVDSSGNAYVTGTTSSLDFPTQNPLQKDNKAYLAGPTAFVAKLNSTGSALVYSTYLGGSTIDKGYGMATDSYGNAYVTGETESTNFPTVLPFQPNLGSGFYFSAFAAKLNAAGSGLIYSTYLGGGDNTSGNGIAVDSSGNAYVVGTTTDKNFPTVNPIQSTCAGCNAYVANGGDSDAFVAKFNSTGSVLLYSTYLGGSLADTGSGIAVDSSGNAYVTGSTQSANFPTMNPMQPTCAGCNDTTSDAFVAKLNAAGTALVYSTFLGGSKGNSGSGIAIDFSGNAYVTGTTSSSDFPTAALQATYSGVGDAFVAELNAAGSGLVYSTYLGGNSFDSGSGIAVDPSGNAYVTGSTDSTNFPQLNPLHPDNGCCNGAEGGAFVAKISAVGQPPSQTITFGPLPNVTNGVLPFTLSATASSGLPVTFASKTPAVCTVSAGAVATVNVGTCSITASQSGNIFYAAAPPVTQSFTVTGTATPPTISGVISASAFGAFSAAAPGTWVEIYGSNLASTTRPWTSADFNGNSAPTSLSGVQVTIGGQPAFVDYISPGQVNAQLSSNIGTGSLQLTVTNAGVTSAPVSFTVKATEPGLLAPPSFKIGANQYVVAQFSDGTYVLPVGAITGITSRPATPGDTIVIYGVGFGPVVPNTPAGQIATGLTQLSASLQFLFGQTPAQQVAYAGLTPGSVGLYQFNIKVPQVPGNNPVPLIFNLGGVPGTQTLYTAVQQQSAAANVQFSFVPPSVAQSSDGNWYYKATLKETAGVGVNLTKLVVFGNDYTSDIQSWFGATYLPANGSLSSSSEAICACTAPWDGTWQVTGTDNNGNTGTWSGVVHFLPPASSSTGQRLHELLARALGYGLGQIVQQDVRLAVYHAVALLDGGLANGLGQVAFQQAGGFSRGSSHVGALSSAAGHGG